MLTRCFIAIFLSTFSFMHAIDWGGERARQLSDVTEIALPVLGFASVVMNSDLAKCRHSEPLKVYGMEIGRGYVTQRDAKEIGSSLLRLACSFAHVSFYKNWVLERRPLYGREDKFFQLPSEIKETEEKKGPAFFSFPSSHSSKMFFGAGTIHSQFGFKAASPFYLLGAACSLIRLSRDNHFAHDLVAGAMIGAKFALTNNIANIMPTPLQDGGAVTITFQY